MPTPKKVKMGKQILRFKFLMERKIINRIRTSRVKLTSRLW